MYEGQQQPIVERAIWESTQALLDNSVTERIERTVAVGLRNRWWCIGPSAMFADQAVGLTRLGTKLVAWRDATGKVNLIDDRCPHRGAPLSLGRLEAGKLSCRYHGVEVAGDGTVTGVPAYPECAYVGKKMVRAYPVVEHFQGVWAWFGVDAEVEPVPLAFPSEFTSADWTGFPVTSTWQTNYQYIWDNVIDIMHPEFLHRDTQYFETGVANKVKVTPTATGFKVNREIDVGDNVEVMEFIDNGSFWFRVGFHAPQACGPGGNWRVFPLATPIDEHRSQMTIWRMRKVAKPKPPVPTSSWHREWKQAGTVARSTPPRLSVGWSAFLRSCRPWWMQCACLSSPPEGLPMRVGLPPPWLSAPAPPRLALPSCVVPKPRSIQPGRMRWDERRLKIRY